MKITIPTLQQDEQLFFASYGIFLVATILAQSFYYRYFAPIYSFLILISITILVIKELAVNKVSLKSLFFAIIFILVSFLIWRKDPGVSISSTAAMFLFIYFGRNISFRKIAKFTVIVASAIIIFVVLSSFIGLIPNYIHFSDRKRQYIGFRYSLYSSTFVSNVSFLYIYCKKDKIKWYNLLLVLLANYIIYSLTQSRLTFFTVVLMIPIVVLLKKGFNPFKFKLVSAAAVFSFVISSAVSLYLSLNYNYKISWFRELNTFLGGRLSLGQRSLRLYGISLFGQQIKWSGGGLDMYGHRSSNDYLWVDSVYIQFLQHYGIIVSVILLIILTATMYKVKKSGDNYLLCILAVLALHGIIDDLILQIYYNTFWFVLGAVWFKEKSNSDEAEIADINLSNSGINAGFQNNS